ncbi:purine-nucleoside phosphorylase, partial [bacterium]
MKKSIYPILEFDDDRKSIIDPEELIEKMDVPEHCVICFFAEVIQWLIEERGAKFLANSKSEIGYHPLYEIDYLGKRLAFFHPGIGAPLAASLLEEVIARGCRKFIAVGGCGVLDKNIAVGHLMLPISALRDEG